jgi:hypothetical protein
MSLKQAAENLLKVAEAIDQQAAEVSTFVCDKCNHTTTLAKINASRKKVAGEIGENVTVSDVTVNDKVHCPAPDCEGVLSYKETEESKGYYYDPEAVMAKDPNAPHSEKTETPKDEAAESLKTQEKEREEGKHEASEKMDYDALERYTKG